MALLRDNSCKCSMVSLSSNPSLIWSLIFFCTHKRLQKLHVFVISLRATKKSSKLSPGCCVRPRRLRRSMNLLIGPSMWCLIACIMVSTLFLCSSDNSRLLLLTIMIVSLDKHRVSTCSFVAASSPASSDSVQ